MFIGESIRLLRLIKGVPQKTVAKKLHISQQAVSKIEHSKNVHDQTFEKYLNALNGSTEDLEKIKNILPPPPINKLPAMQPYFSNL